MKNKAYKKLPIIEPLEPRLLFSAGLEGLLAPELIPPTTAALSSAFLEELVTNTPVTPDTQPAAEVRQELVFVDTDTPDYRQLVDDLLESEQGDRQLEVILLDNTRDGISQISETLASYHNLAAVHLISHGEAGSVDLGGTRLEFDSLLANAKTIQDWGQAFAADGDFLIYGCNLAASADGQSLVDALARLTSTDVAASDDLTGSSELGGDWELEYKSGEIDSEFSFSAETQHGWSALLATDITTNSTSSDATAGAANSLTWSHTVNSGSNRILTVGMSLINGQSTSVTYGGTPLTLVGRHSGTHTIEIWQLTAPAVGTADIVANFSGSLEVIGGAAAYNNVNQATPTGTFQGAGSDSSTASVTVSSAPGELVIDTLFVDLNVTATTGADQAEQWNLTNGRLGAGSTEDGAASVTMSWDLSPGEEWDIAAVGLKPSNNILVNQTITNGQQDADIALFADGSFITVWKSSNDDNNYDTSGDGVYGRLFNSDGSPASNEFLINQTTTSNQNQPSVITSDNGNFLVAWTSNQSGTSDIYARVFDSSGTPLTNEILINSDYIAGSQSTPDIAVDDAGNFVVAWTGEGPGDSTGIWGRSMNADGTPNGNSFLAHTATIASEESPAVAMNGSGAFVITWVDKSGASNIVLAQRYDNGGTGKGVFTVHAMPGGAEKAPAVAMDDTGNFTIAWEQSGADASGFGILHRRFAADGTPLDATDQLVNAYTAGGQTEAAIASNSTGDYIITWTSADQDGDVKGIIGQAYSSDGSKDGNEFIINDYITNDQLSSQVAINDTGYIAAIWHGEGADDAQGVYAQLLSPFQVTTTADVADGDTSSIIALTSNKGADGLISLREAITAANNTTGSDTIDFNIPLTDGGHVYYQDDGITNSLSRIAATTLPDASIPDFDPDYPGAGYSWYSIQVDSALPQITDAVRIDATTQPGYADKPIIELNGDGAATGNIAAGRRVQLPWGGDGFDPATLTAEGETIMRRSLEWASQTPAPGNLLFVVPDEASLAADDLAKKVLMEGWGYTVNVIDVHDPQDAFDAAVLINDVVFISENIDSVDLGTKLRDAAIGVVTEEDNLSDEFGMASGIVWDAAATAISIDDNTHYITSPFATGPLTLFTVGQSLAAVNGTLSPDLQALGSSASGPGLVAIEAGQALYDGSSIGGITIAAGGAGSTLEGLVINRFNNGIFITGGDSNTLQGNYIGTDVTGTRDLGNTGNGIEISNSADNLIGGTVAAERNLVSGNNNDGISIWGGGTTGTVIQGNTVGSDVSGTVDLGNTQYGIIVSGGATDNLIGGSGLNEGNRVSGNDNHGVVIKDASTKRNTIRGNSIAANEGLGINLTGGTEDANFVTSNDTGDGDTGANDLQNYPILTRAAVSVTSITISGYLDGAAGSDFAIDFYASTSADPSGYGEGETYLGSTTITTESSGRGIFYVTLNEVVAAGSSITATATELANGDTSEFSGSFASNAAGNVLWLSTEEDVPDPSGVNGLAGEALRGGDVLELGGPALAFEPGVSNGTFSHVANFNEQVVPGNGRINAMHYVGRDMTLAGGVSVQEGDLLLSFFSDETVVNSDTSTLPVSLGDVLLFRPDVFGDYSAGMFSILVDGSDIGLTSILGISLVEQDTVVGTGAGTTNLNAGDFLLVNWHSGATPSAGADPEEIQYFRPTNLGATTTAGTVAVLVDGMDLGLVSGNAFVGIDLVEEDMTIGGANLLSGQILTSTDGNYTLSGTPVDEHDVFILDVTDTGASTVATATVLLEGADVGLNAWQEDLRGLTLVNAPNDAPVAVNDNPGLDFDGIDDYVSIADSASLTMTNTVTMEAWINPDPSANANRMIINKEGEYEVALLPDGTLNWAFANTDPGWTWHNTGYVVPDGEWIHIAVSYNNGTVSTYVNATLIDVYNGSGVIGDAHLALDELRIGGRSNNPAGKYFDGRIDDVRIWNTARTQTEIQATMDQAMTGGEAGLAGYWNFNTGSGTSAADLTANANTGTLIDGGAGTAGPQWTGYSTDQNTQINIAAGNGILSNDIDVNGDTLTVTHVNGSGANVGSLFTLPSGSNLTVGTLGDFIYDPNGALDYLAAGEAAVDTFTYQISDGNGGTDIATVSITITGTNDAPVAVADTDATTENAGVTTDVIANDTDVDATDVLSLQAASASITSMTNDADSAPVAVVSANVTQSGNDITFNPGTDFDYLATGETATVVIGYTVTDDDGTPLTDAGTLTVTVTGTNDAPVAVADVDATTENAGVSTDVIANDTPVDATDVLSLEAASASITSMTNDADSAPVAVVSANVTQSGNDITFNPGTDFDYLATGETATVVIGYTVTDDDGTPLTDAGTLTVTVTGTNDAPVAVADTDATTENAGVTTDVITNDTAVDATDVLSLQAASASITSMTNDADSAPVAVVSANVTQSGNDITFNPGTDFDYLATGETATVVIGYTVTDDDGTPLTDAGTLTVTVTGTNDAPVAVADVDATTENAGVSTDVIANDTPVDATDVLSLEAASASITSMTNDADSAPVAVVSANVTQSGNDITFNPGTDFDYLATGETATVVIGYTVTDDDGTPLTDAGTLTVTVTGTNDAPVAVADTDSTTENAGVTADVIANDTDVDATDVLSLEAASASITSMTNDADSAPVAVVSANVTQSGNDITFNPGTDFDYLATGETATVVIGYTVTDDDGTPLTDAGTLTVTVTGTNDAPVAVADTDSTTENAGVTTDVIANDTPVDATDVLSLQAASASITSMTNDVDSAPVAVLTANVTQSGNDITFNPGTDFDYLATGETATVVIGYTVTDDDGTPLTDAGTLTVTVTGTNDAPVAVADTDSTTENAGVTTDVIVNDTDVDATDVLSLQAASASITSMTNDADSAPVAVLTANVTQSGDDITFNPGTDFDYLATGETATVVIGYTVTDDDGTPLTDAGTLTVTVTGTNDAPVAVADTDATTENAGVTTDVIANDTPVDATDVLSLQAASASITSMTNDADSAPVAVLTANVTQSGNDITFNPGTDFDYLATGETATVVIGYTVTDDDGTPLSDAGTLTVTVTGTNDAPVAVADVDATTENAGVTTDVIANDTPVDATDVLSLQAASAGITSMTNDADSVPVAVLTANVTQSGNDITFNPGTDFDYLATGETATVVIGYTVTDDDGTPLTNAGTLTVTVTGTNDAPVAVADTDATTENAGVTTDVITNDTPVDATDVLSLQAASASITSMTNDADSAPVAVVSANVTQSGNDITFNPGTDFDYLATGETATVVIGYTVTDDDGTPLTDAGTLTVTVTGTNDAPVAVADVDATTENAGVTTDVITNDTPVDATDVLSLEAASASITSMTNDADSAPVAVLTANVTQSGNDITFNPGTDFDYLATGETATVVIGYTVTDDDGTPLTDAGTLTVTVTGTNDAPVAVADTDSTTENAGVTTDVIVNDTDVDATDVLSLQAASASITSMTNDADSAPVAVVSANVTQSGNDITFNPGTDFDYLATGETATVVIGYTVTDDDVTPLTDAGTLTVTVTGTNDAPVAVADLDATTENAEVTTDVITNDTDVDVTDVLSLQAASASITSMTNDVDSAPVAVVSANVTQSGNDITFNPGTDFDYLATGETATVVIGYTVTDDDGTPLTDAGTLTVTVTGTNDAPVAVADTDSTTENAGVTTDVITNDTAVDATDVLSLQAASASITSMTNDADSAPVAVLTANVTQSGNDITFNPGTDFDYLATGETATVVIGYTVTDDDSTPLTDAGTLTVTVTGTNDAPVAVADTDSTTENAGVTTDVIANDTDVDATDVLSLQAASASITSMTNDADSAPVAVVSANVTQSGNDITFNPGTDFDYLATGETATVVIGYTVTDDDGTPLTDAGTLTVTVTGTNDAPVAVADTDATTENAGVTTDVIANDTDVDATDVLSLQAASASITSMTNDADSAPVVVVSANVTQSGNDITFNPGTDFDYLATGETATVVIGYTVTDDDGTPLSDAGTLTVTVTGTNDAPVAVADTDATTENAGVTTDVIANDTPVDATDVLSLQAASASITSMTNDADSAPVAVVSANVTQSGNDITFNPGTDFDYLATGETATVVIGYTVTDDDGTPLTDAGTLTVTVTGTNDAPVAVADTDSTTENAGVTTDVITNDTDVDATDVLSLQAASASITSMTNDADSAPVAVLTANVTQSGNDITFNPGTDFDYLATGETATVVIGYTVTDDDGTPLTDAGTLTVTVTGTNDTPVAVADTDSTTENAGVTTDVIANDTDPDATDVLSLQAASASITSMTNDADSAPVAVVSANVTQSGDEITFNPGTDFDYLATGETATVVIGYTVTDDDGTPLTDAGTLTVTVTGTNDAPVAVADTDSTTENAGVTTDVITNDTDVDATDVLSLQAASASITSMTNDADSAAVTVVSANVSQSGNEITFNPGTDFDYLATGETATVVIGYTVTDDDGTPLTDAGTLTVIVTGTNDAPTLTTFAAVVETTNEDTEVEITFAELVAQGDEFDVDGSVVAFVVKAVPTGSLKLGTSAVTATAWVDGSNDTIDASNHAYWTPAPNANGTLNALTVVGKDNLGLESNANVIAQSNVTSVNDVPVADTGGPYAINEGNGIMLDASASSDVDGNPLTYSWDMDNDGSFGDLIGAGPALDWAQLQSFGINDDGLYTIHVQVDDGNTATNIASTTLTVNNASPTLTTTGATNADEGQIFTLNLGATDPGNDTITSWTINWGDGSIETIAGNPGSVTHIYAGGGTFPILASVVDEDGTHLQNELLVPALARDSVFRFEETTALFLQEFGSSGDGLDGPYNLRIGPDGNVYAPGYWSSNIVRYDPSGTFIDEFVPASSGGLSNPYDIAFGPDGNLYVTSTTTHQILRYDGTTGAFVDVFANTSSAGLNGPIGLAFDLDGKLYVSGYATNNILRYDISSGTLIDEFVSPGNGANSIEAMTFGPDGNLYIVNFNADSVLRYDGATGTFIDEFLNTGGTGLDGPNGLAFGPDGHLYVSGYLSNQVLRFDGTTGAYIDAYVPAATAGLDRPGSPSFVAGHRVTVNGAPDFTLTTGDLAYLENDGAVPVDPGLVLVDYDDVDISSAIATITTNYANGEDILSFIDTATISGSWDGASGILTLTGLDTVSNYQAALRSITYTNTSENPDMATRTVEFIANDGAIDSNPVSRNITITPVNDAPSGSDYTVTILEDMAYTFSAANFDFNDVLDGDAFIAVKITTLPAAGILTNNGLAVNAGNFISKGDIDLNHLVFTPAPDANGAPYTSFTFQVQDDGGTTDGGVNLDQSANTMTIDVTAVNDAPVAVADTDATTENAGVTTDVITNDTDVDATDVLSLQAASASITSMTNDADSAPVAVVSANVTQSGNDITFNPGTDFDYLATGETATVVIGYTVTDDDGTPLTDAGTLTVTVTGTNDAPVAVADTDATTENAGVTTDVITNDTDVDATDVLSLQAASASITSMTNDADSAPVAVVSANVTQSGNDITFNPGTDFDYLATGETATVVIGYTVTDDDGTPLTDADTLTVTVTGTNDAPVAVADTDSTTENAGVTTDVITNDTDPDATDVLSLQAASASITSMTNDADSAPVAVVSANVTQSGNDITFNPGTDFDYLASSETATVVIGYTVTDDDGTPLTDAGTLTVTVTGTNDAPVAVADTDATTENAGVTTDVIVNDTDLDATDVLSLQAVSVFIDSMTNDADNTAVTIDTASVSQSDDDITFNPGTDFDYLATGETATVVIGYTVTDDDGTPLIDAGTLTVTVTGTNDAPVAIDDAATLDEAAAITIDVASNDTDLDNPLDLASLTVIDAPEHGTLVINDDGTMEYLHDGSETTADAFTYTIADADGAASNTATVTLSINPVQDILESAPPVEPAPEPEPESEPEPEPEIEEPVVEAEPDAPDTLKSGTTLSTVTTSLEVPGFSSTDTRGDTEREERRFSNPVSRTLNSLIQSTVDATLEMWQMIDSIRVDMGDLNRKDSPISSLLAKSAGGITLSLSAGVVTWALRGGSLLASMLTSMPLWKGFDPLPVLAASTKQREEEDQDSEEDADNEAIDDFFDQEKRAEIHSETETEEDEAKEDDTDEHHNGKSPS